MLGLDDYGSDSEDDSVDVTTPGPGPSKSVHATANSTKSTFALPPPKSITGQSNNTQKKKVIKIAIERPQNLKHDDEDTEERATKKRRLEPVGKSSLIGLLPAPQKMASELPAKERVLGGGGGPALVFKSLSTNATDETLPSVTSFLPPSLAKNKNKDVQNASESSSTGIDPFSLGFFTARPNVPLSVSSNAVGSSLKVSSAPAVTTFAPPDPSMDDPYPGYYQLPSGQWAQYDPEFYRDFWEEKRKEWEAQNPTIQKGFEDAHENAQDISAQDQMDHAAKLREEKKALTEKNGNPAAKPNMNIAVCSLCLS